MTSPSDHVKQQMLANAREITRLNTRIHETFASRNKSAQSRELWTAACAEFHCRYDELAFPGGYGGAIERILAGDSEAVEAALCFCECRPYFFRSGYMYKELLRKTKRAPMTESQAERFKVVLQCQAEWRARKQVANAA
jgi:hypothetical protein